MEKNRATLFGGLTDFRVEVLRSTTEGDTLWVEWRRTGTRADGTRLARGALGARAGRLAWGSPA